MKQSPIIDWRSSTNSKELEMPFGILRMIRNFARYAPPLRGKNFLIRNGLLKLARNFPSDVKIRTRDGFQFLHCNLNQHIYRELAIYGTWEADVSWIYDHVLQGGDTVLDVGACFGYHAVRAAKLVGGVGRVYAVEPQPEAFASLQDNLVCNGITNVETDCVALTSQAGVVELHRFNGLDLGNTSVSTLDRTDYEVIRCHAKPLDDYVESKGIEDVTLVKLDVEGAERSVLSGSTRLLSSNKPPMWVLEINVETARSCGYHPEDLLALLRSLGYSFYRPARGAVIRTMRRLTKCNAGSHGDNLLCAIADIHHDRLVRAGVGAD